MARVARYTTRILIVAAALSVACSQDEVPTTPGSAPTTEIDNSLVFHRADSTIVTMGTGAVVCCGIYDPTFVNERAMQIAIHDVFNPVPFWQFLLLTEHAQAGTVTMLPTTLVPPSKVSYVSMFVADTGNQMSSDQAASTGTITVHSFSCTPTSIRIDFDVDAVLASEFAVGAPMRVKGRFRATFPAESCP
jgi:hypothetical protein